MASLCTILLDIYIPGVNSLKEKRGIIKPIISKLRRNFNTSIAEVEYHDVWNRAVFLCAITSNDKRYCQQQAMKLVDFVNNNFLSVNILSHHIDFLM